MALRGGMVEQAGREGKIVSTPHELFSYPPEAV
jgi:hypothetical protein